MDRADFLQQVREQWNGVQPEESKRTQNDAALQWVVEFGEDVQPTQHWRIVAHRTYLELLNNTTQRELLAFVKGVTTFSSYTTTFGTSLWFSVFYHHLFVEVLPLTHQFVREGEVGDFFIRLYTPRRADFSRYLTHYFDRGYPIFGDKANARLRMNVEASRRRNLSSREQIDSWLALVKFFYRAYFGRVTDIYILRSKKDSSRPPYKLMQPMGIAPDQRVFLAAVVDRSTKQVVVKWAEDDPGEDEYLRNWRRIRRTGAKMLWFDTSYELTPIRRVLVMEKLSPIDHTDQPREFLYQIMQQLYVIHRAKEGPYVHADLKLDNTLKRMNKDGTKEFFIIDWDTVSHHKFEGVAHAVQREAFSPLWTSQTPGFKPTSYRYDLQELFYAAVDLVKKQRTFAWRDNERVPLWMADSDTLIRERAERKIGIPEIRKEMQVNFLSGFGRSSQLFARILNLPERAPVEQIDYSEMIERLSPARRSSALSQTQLQHHPTDLHISEPQNDTHTPMQKCVQCERTVAVTMCVQSEDESMVEVCGIVCAALQNPERYYDTAAEHKSISRKTQPHRGKCGQCGKPTECTCACGIFYCGTVCQSEHWPEHQKACTTSCC